MFLLNGQSTGQITVEDRGLHYGDGLFETIAVYKQKPLCWSQHILRLQSGCGRLGIECPEEAILEGEARQLCPDVDKAVLKIIVTRGQGGRGYRVPEQGNTTRILGLYPWPEFPAEHPNGVITQFCRTRLGRNSQLAGIKHLNRLEQILARREWSDPMIAEGIVLDDMEHVIEGTMSNLFIMSQGQLLTPDLSECGVAGITRENIVEHGTVLGIEIIIKRMTVDELLQADEIFLCNSVIGIWPVKQIGKQVFKTGPWTERIREVLQLEGLIAPV